MESFSTMALVVLAIIVYQNFAKGGAGQLQQWARSKFFNSSAPPPTGGSSSGLLGAIGSLHRPVPGAVTSAFGVDRGDHTHEGVDLAAAEGDPIEAAGAGRVSARTSGGNCGNRIDLDHGNGLVTRYCHLSRFAVDAGTQVARGQTIGYVGSTGDATGPHLHFEVRKNGVAVDPMPYLGGG